MAHRLRTAGHRVFAPTLTGLAELSGLLSRDTGLDTHVADVVELMLTEDLREVFLVGHSYSGMVIEAVADRLADRIDRLLHLDSVVPEDGQCMFELLPTDRREHYLRAARDQGAGWLVPPPPAQAFGLPDGSAATDVDARLTPQPLRAFLQPVVLTGAAVDVPRSYVHCTSGPIASSFAPFADRFRGKPGWTGHALATGHDAMLTAPEELCEVLLGLAAGSAGREQ